jgi:hypothetical protein
LIAVFRQCVEGGASHVFIVGKSTYGQRDTCGKGWRCEAGDGLRADAIVNLSFQGGSEQISSDIRLPLLNSAFRSLFLLRIKSWLNRCICMSLSKATIWNQQPHLLTTDKFFATQVSAFTASKCIFSFTSSFLCSSYLSSRILPSPTRDKFSTHSRETSPTSTRKPLSNDQFTQLP